VATLGICLGANTAVFSILENILLRPLPFRDADRLVAIWSIPKDQTLTRISASGPEFQDYKEQSRSLERLASVVPRFTYTWTGQAEPKTVNFRRILVGYDGSPSSEKALEAALAIANTLASAVEVLSVIQPPEPSTSTELNAVLDDAREHYEKAHRRIAQAAAANGLRLDTDVKIGHPAEQIIHRAELGRADLIVLGHRGVSKFEKLIMGSVSERVLAYAHCPVLVTR
jgi:nucleotide-binding universal stress UspA family protein